MWDAGCRVQDVQTPWPPGRPGRPPPWLLSGFEIRVRGVECRAWGHPGDNPGASAWFLWSTPIQILPPGGSIYGRLTSNLPMG